MPKPNESQSQSLTKLITILVKTTNGSTSATLKPIVEIKDAKAQGHPTGTAPSR